MVVPFVAGGSTDVLARALAPVMEKYLGNNARIIVLNRPGASGDLGMSYVAKAAADGYTFGFITSPVILTVPIASKTSYTWKSFDLLGNVVDDPCGFSVHSDSAFKNLADLIAYAKAHPGEVTVGTTGAGSDDHLAMLLLEKTAGIKLSHIPFKGSAEVRTALLGKVINVAAINVSEGVSFQLSGTPLRNLGQTAAERSKLAPGVPTFKEQGHDVDISAIRALGAPKDLPPEARQKLVKALEQAMADPELQNQINTVLFQPVRYMSPAQLATSFEALDPKFRQLWAEVPWVDK
ncbi:MAG: tripartite tricarboxylate transporter substrate binding protein [Comamonadaceae bacterium]|nr:MAG: tripartite tricarboxylate transporter substrate binding protein [Comamonadaceae bacterium]